MNLKRPSAEAYRQALDAAARMSDADVDPHSLAASLRYLHARSASLEALFHVTDRYLRFGMPEHELTEMRQLVAQLREEQLAADGSGDVDATLPI
jgi:hypothetical protein